MSERDPRGVDALVTFETDPHGNRPGTPAPAEEIYSPPENPRFTATPTPTPAARSVKPVQPRENLPETPHPSSLRRNREPEARTSGSRLFLVLGAVGLLALGCTGVAAVGAGVIWMQLQPVATPEPVEVVAPAEPEAPPEVGGIPLENRLRRGPAAEPSRPNVP